MKSLNKAADIMLLGFSGLNVHKVRSFLTSLSIIFGVGCVIASLAINAAASSEAQKSLRELGSDNIIVNAVKPPADSTAKGGFGALRYGITKDDVIRLRDNIPNVKKCVIVHRTKKHAMANKKRMAVSIIATEPTYAEVARVEMRAGRFFHAKDMLRFKTHCILTYPLARQLFGHSDPMGRYVNLGGVDFCVIGVLNRLPRAMIGDDAAGADRQVLIPLSTDEAAFGPITRFGSPGSYVYEQVDVHQMILHMTDEQAVLDGARVARSLLGRFHARRDYHVVVPIEEIKLKNEQKRIWNIVMLLIAGVSLLVGGIGIMNIMLASVTERTREIGIRRALGAKRSDITIQFLVEAVTLTTVGGLLGIALGLATPRLIERFLKFPVALTPSMLWLPFAVAVLVGLLSGIYPAIRAAMLDPIDALRHE